MKKRSVAAVASLAAGFVAALVSPAPGAHAAGAGELVGSLPVSGQLLDEVTGSASQAAAQATADAAKAGPNAAKAEPNATNAGPGAVGR